VTKRTTLTSSYAVIWREPGGPTFAGELALARGSLRLDGSGPDGSLGRVRIRYGDLAGVRVGRSPEERLNGLPCVILERRAGPPISIGPVSGTGTVFAVGQALAELISEQAASSSRAAIVVPIRPEKADRVRELLAQGPPFDPASTSLERHEVYLTEREVIFVFEGPGVQTLARELVKSPAAWRAASAWRECISGRPVAAEPAYSWARGRDSGR
jgi:hypothetical protein